MRRTLIKILLTILTLQAFVVSARAYSIKLEIDLPDQYVFLCQYHGFQSLTLDSTKCKNGTAKFSGTTTLPQGIYYIRTKEKKLFDFLFADGLNLSSDCEDPAYHLNVSGNEASKSFNEAHKTILQYWTQRDERTELLSVINLWKGNNVDTLKVQNEIDSLDKFYLDFLQREWKKQKKNDFLSGLYKMAYAAQCPDCDLLSYIDFSNPELLNTPEYSFRKLIESYCWKNISSFADNITTAIANAEHLVQLTDPKSEFRKYILNKLVLSYTTINRGYHPDIRLEAVACYLFDKYYKEKPWWMSDYDYTVMKWEYDITKYNIIGMQGKDIVLPDQNGQNHSLYGQKSKYKILVFWDSECEVCIEKVGYIQADYPSLKAMGAEVFAVYTEAEYDQWKEYIAENELNWINVSDPEGVGTYDYDYGTYKTPRLYLLDENNIILAKDFDYAKIIETIASYEKNK